MGVQLTQSTNFEKVNIPARVYDAVLVNIEQKEIKSFDDPTQMQKVLFWAFQIAGSSKTVTIEGMTTMAFGPKSKAFDWAKNILGNEPPKTMDTDELLNRPCKVQVEDAEKNGEKYSRIKAVIPGGADEDLPF